MSGKHVPEFKWAENENKIFLTIEVPKASKADIKIEKDNFHFADDQDGKHYAVDFGFFKSVNPEKSTYAIRDRGIEILLEKGDKGWWQQLIKDKYLYKGHCKIDWDLWRDEDEEEKPVGNFGAGDFDFGANAPDSDDDDLPDLEEAPKEPPTKVAPASGATDTTDVKPDDTDEADD